MNIFEVQGAIFDIDDTLLDNKSGSSKWGLHERSRLRAVHIVGKKYGIIRLEKLTAQENMKAFLNAPAHTMEAAVWEIIKFIGYADSSALNPEHPLLKEIVELKNKIHHDVLLKCGKEVPGASKFVHKLGKKLPNGKLAVASSAIRRDINTSLEMLGLTSYFSQDRIISKESITHAKPHPEVFLLAFNSLDLPQDKKPLVCAFEDDPRGIMSAKVAGLYVCAITTRFRKEELRSLEVPPDLIADSFDEFSELLTM